VWGLFLGDVQLNKTETLLNVNMEIFTKLYNSMICVIYPSQSDNMVR